jgi:asparagine synthase (glutamine-hydrolysing)
MEWGRAVADALSTSIGAARSSFVFRSCDAVFVSDDRDLSFDDTASGNRGQGSYNVAVAADARLDNLGQVKSKLRARDEESAPNGAHAGAQLAAAYRAWKGYVVEEIIGDFAIAVWDENERALFLMRDPFGIKPLYYTHVRDEVWFSTELAILLKVTKKPHRLDESFVAGYLTYTEEASRTPYQDIEALRPGTILRVTSSGAQARAFWAPEPRSERRYKSDTEYVEAFLGLFEEAVSTRMAVKGPVVAELSGGLDSSSIVCTASRLVKDRKVPATSLHTVSFLYDGVASVDESAFREAVIDKAGVPNSLLYDDNILSPDYLLASAWIPNPHRMCTAIFDQSVQHMNHLGASVLLSGMCGDHVFLYDVSHLSVMSYHLTRGELSAIHTLALLSAKYGQVSYWHTVWLGAVWPWLPASIRVRLSPKRTRLPGWIDASFARRTECQLRALVDPGLPRWLHPSTRHRCGLVQNAVSVAAAQYYRAQTGVNVAFPYLHLPLVQFLLDIPADQFVRPHEDRSIQRRAMCNILPEAVRTRLDKKGPTESLLRGLRKHWPTWERLLAKPISAQLGIVNGTATAEALRKLRFGTQDATPELLRWVSLEAWLQSLGATGVLAL